MHFRTHRLILLNLTITAMLGAVGLPTEAFSQNPRPMSKSDLKIENKNRERLGLPPIGSVRIEQPKATPTPIPGSIAEELAKREVLRKEQLLQRSAPTPAQAQAETPTPSIEMEREKLEIEREKLRIMQERLRLEQRTESLHKPSGISVVIEDAKTTGVPRKK